MASPRSAAMNAQEETVRLLALQIRLQLGSQGEAIKEFSKLGFGPSRIAELRNDGEYRERHASEGEEAD